MQLRAADAALAGGFPAEGLTEIHVDETRGSGVGAGFALSLAVLFQACQRRPALWIGDGLAFSEAGCPYLPGLLGHGLDPGALLLVPGGAARRGALGRRGGGPVLPRSRW